MNFDEMYNQLINKAKKDETRKKLKPSDPKYVCYHGHHIIPRCMGGEGSSQDWNHPNIVPLTPAEHWDAHYYLWKAKPDILQYAAAFWLTRHSKNLNRCLTKEEYVRLKEDEAKFQSVLKTGDRNPMYRRSAFEGKTEEEMSVIGQNLSNALKGKNTGRRIIHKETNELRLIGKNDPVPEGFELLSGSGRCMLSDETRKKMSDSAKARGTPKCAFRKRIKEEHPLYGIGHREESKRKMSESKKGKYVGKRWWNDGENETLQYECPNGFKSGRLYERKRKTA